MYLTVSGSNFSSCIEIYHKTEVSNALRLLFPSISSSLTGKTERRTSASCLPCSHLKGAVNRKRSPYHIKIDIEGIFFSFLDDGFSLFKFMTYSSANASDP